MFALSRLNVRCSNVRLFLNVRKFECSDVRMFACSNVQWFSNVRLFNVQMFFNSSPWSVFVCSNVRRTRTNIRTLNTNVRCSVAPALIFAVSEKMNRILQDPQVSCQPNLRKDQSNFQILSQRKTNVYTPFLHSS